MVAAWSASARDSPALWLQWHTDSFVVTARVSLDAPWWCHSGRIGIPTGWHVSTHQFVTGCHVSTHRIPHITDLIAPDSMRAVAIMIHATKNESHRFLDSVVALETRFISVTARDVAVVALDLT
jgi:hypothetical protein